MGTNTSYSSPKVEMRESQISGRGLFAKEKIMKGELIVSFESSRGRLVNSKIADELYANGNDHILQIGDDLYFNTTTCRKIITDDDWKIIELQKKYRGYFSKYLQKRIG